MSWSFVGRQTTSNTINGALTGTITLPAGVNGGDFIAISMPNTTGSGATTCSVAGFTAWSNQVTRLGNAHDQLWTGWRVAAGTAGSATSDTTFTITFGANTWTEFDVIVLRSTLGVGTVTYTLAAGSSTYTATLTPAVLSPTPGGGDLTLFGYGGQNAALSGTEQMATAPTSLSNWPATCPTLSGNGGVVGIGWGTGVTAPGNAAVTVNSATLATLDSCSWAAGVTEQAPVSPPGPPPQPGGQTWRRKHRRIQPIISFAQSPDLTVTAGLAPGTGAAADFSAGLSVTIGVNATLAAGAGAAGSPVVTDAVNAGLASGTGTSQQPTVTLTVNAGLAMGTGTAQSPLNSATIPAGLATGTGTSQSPTASLKINAGLATGTGTSQSPTASLTVNAGLATGTGTAQSPVASITVNAGLATGTGTAFGPTIPTASFAGLATGTGTALSPTVTLTVNAGLATGTGTAFAPGTSSRTIGLATGTGTSQQPTVSLTVTAGLATGTGSAFGPSAPRTAGLATGTGAAGSPVVTIAVNATLAHGTGTAQSPPIPLTVTAGLATGTGSAFTPTAPRTAGLATGTGTAFDISVAARKNVDFTGSTLSAANTLGGTLTIATLDGTLTVAANTLGGTASVASNLLGGTVTIATLGGTAAVTSDTLTGTLSVATNTLSGTAAEDKMQEVDIILNEFNDATVTFQILNNGTPYNITGMTVNALFKKTRGDLDSAGTTKTYSSGGGSPAITIVTPTTGSCTLAIPDGDITTGTVWSFYRIDVVSGTVTTTSIFGTVTITLL